MSLAEKVFVNTRYTRSTNVERDRNSRDIVDAYLPTSRAIRLLENVLDATKPSDQPRAWSLIGPYGSGKSSFGLFLSHLLAPPQSPSRNAGCEVLSDEHGELASAFAAQPPWCRVAVTGSAEPLVPRLLSAMHYAAKDFWIEKKGRKPTIISELEAANVATKVTTGRVMELVTGLQAALEKVGSGGLLFVIDELGKFLEYEARHYGANDIFLLQSLAEHAYRGRKTNVIVFAMLHQGFELYARGLSESLKNDWAKVQGRFENVPFIETTEQILRIVSAAFSNTFNKKQSSAVHRLASAISKQLAAAGVLPSVMNVEVATDLFSRCYPIHPVALLALPALCQKFAQNERTLFSYLGSCEPHGFQHALQDVKEVGAWVDPSSIYDYFIQNQTAVLADPLAHRRWAEVVTAVERAESIGIEAQRLAKCVGLLNLISGAEAIKPSFEVMATLFDSTAQCSEVIGVLEAASIVQHRKFSGEYRVWQGTDFNLDEAVQVEAEKLGRFELAPTLSDRLASAPIVARRHSIETGSLRYFEVDYADAQSYTKLPAELGVPRVVFFLAEGKDDEALFDARVRQHFSDRDVCVLYRNGSEIRSAIRETLAIEGVQRSAQELASDPVASRELKERLKAARANEQLLLSDLIGKPSRSDWYWKDVRLSIGGHRELQAYMSEVMDSVYCKSALIRNELINRDRLSSQAAAARNKLFSALLECADRPGLAIEKYPPERAIYRSLFAAGGLHVETDGVWHLRGPSEADPLHLRPLWTRIERFFESSESGPLTASALMEELAAPPFGLKLGVFPLLFMHSYLVHQHEVAFYEEGRYVPTVTYEHFERFCRKPELYSFQRFRIDGLRANLFQEYAKALFGESRDRVDVLGIAKPLTRFMFGLEEYAQKTRRISELALKVRQAFFLSKSPEKLLFEELPAACGYAGIDVLDGYSQALIHTLRDLKQAYASLLDEFRVLLCEAFSIQHNTSLSDLRDLLRARCHNLDQYTVDVKGLKGFIRRVRERSANDQEWFGGLLLFLGHKPAANWTDQDRDAAEYRLSEFARRLLDLEKLRLHYDANAQKEKDFDVILIKSLKKGGEEIDEVVSINDKTRSAIADSRSQITKVLGDLGDNELRLALVAELVDEFLCAYRRAQRSTVRSDEGEEAAIND